LKRDKILKWLFWLFAAMTVASAVKAFGQGVFEETPAGIRMGMKWAVGNVGTNAGFHIAGITAFGSHNTNDTVNYWIYAFRNVPGPGSNRVYSAVAATNASALTSNRNFTVEGEFASVPGTAGYVVFASLNGGPATNWTENIPLISDPFNSDNGLFQWNDEGFFGWQNTPRDFPPVPLSPFFLGAEIKNQTTNAVVTNTAAYLTTSGTNGLAGTNDQRAMTFPNAATVINLASSTNYQIGAAVFVEAQPGTFGGVDAINAADGWSKLTLNASFFDNKSSFTLSSSVMTVNSIGAGIWRVRADTTYFPASAPGMGQIRLRRTNHTAATLVKGVPQVGDPSLVVPVAICLDGVVPLASGDTLELQGWSEVDEGTFGATTTADTGESNVVKTVLFTRIQ